MELIRHCDPLISIYIGLVDWDLLVLAAYRSSSVEGRLFFVICGQRSSVLCTGRLKRKIYS